MLKLKPTILIALDAFTAAFCDRAQTKLERDLDYKGNLVQSYGLNDSKDAPRRIEGNLSSLADFSFTLSPGEGLKEEFDFDVAELESDLSEILQAGTRAIDIQNARQAGVEIANDRAIYLLMSAIQPSTGRTAIELARLIHFLFITRFPQKTYALHAIVLLPNMFEHPQPTHFAAAYTLLKQLDYSLSSDLVISPTRKVPAFDGCWLLDGINGRGEIIGTLAEELDSYTDAFTGFLTAEPEMSGALVGTRTPRGKVPAYSAFGHGELYFPAEIAVKRLSSALARDIIDQAFLFNGDTESDLERKSLLSAKQFVFSNDYKSLMNGLETDNGALIWKDLGRTPEMQREDNTDEYIANIQQHHERFERDSLPRFKQALLARSESCLAELTALLDGEIDRRIDHKPEGLREVPVLLKFLVDHSIALHSNAVGERPQNFTTDLFAAEAMLDATVGIQVDHSKTDEVLKQVEELSSHLRDLETTSRITSFTNTGASIDEANGSETQARPLEKLASEIQGIRSELASASEMYMRELIAEQRIANQARQDMKDKVRANRTETVRLAEEEITRTAQLLKSARLNLEDKQQLRHKFLVRHFIIYPGLASLLFVIPAIGAVFGLPLLSPLAAFFLLYLFASLVVTLVSFTIYSAIVLFFFISGIDKAVKAARSEVNALELQLKAARVRLIDARNLQLRLEYDIYAQLVRVETLNKLIETTRRRITELGITLKTLEACRSTLAAQHESMVPSWSYMRRPLLDAPHIDTYYKTVVTSVDREAATFIHDYMPRSQVRHLPIHDFQSKLETFTHSRFQTVADLSVEDVLLRSPHLVSGAQATLRLEELDRASTPLLLLSDMNLNDDAFAQKDVTIWAGVTNGDLLLESYRKVNSTTTVRAGSDSQTLRALTRCLNFPAFHLGQIEFYRSCYEREHPDGVSTLPDLIPDELTISSDSKRAYEQLLIAVAMGVISNNGDGTYKLVNGSGCVVANTRRQVAEKFAADFSTQKIYNEISNKIAASDSDEVYQALVDFSSRATDLEPFEREMLQALSQKYHPLR